MVCHPLHGQVEELLMKLEEKLLLLLLLLKRPGQVLMERYKAGLGDSAFAQGWRGSVQARRWFE